MKGFSNKMMLFLLDQRHPNANSELTGIPIQASLRSGDELVGSLDGYVLEHDPIPFGPLLPVQGVINLIAFLAWLALVVPVIVRYFLRRMATRHSLQKLMEWLEDKPPADEWNWQMLIDMNLSNMREKDGKTITEASHDDESHPILLENNSISDMER